jgi:plasmid maintenance system antidote protein VapI
MLLTKKKPVSAGTLLVEEFLEPLGLTQTELVELSGLPRRR